MDLKGDYFRWNIYKTAPLSHYYLFTDLVLLSFATIYRIFVFVLTPGVVIWICDVYCRSVKLNIAVVACIYSDSMVHFDGKYHWNAVKVRMEWHSTERLYHSRMTLVNAKNIVLLHLHCAAQYIQFSPPLKLLVACYFASI